MIYANLIMHLINHVITYFLMVLPPYRFCFLFLPTQTWISSEQSRIASAELHRSDTTLVWAEKRVCSKHYKLKFTAKLCYIQYWMGLKLQDLWAYLGVTTPPLLAVSSQSWPVLVPTIILTTFHHTYTLKSVIQIRRLTTDKSQNLYYKFSLLPFLCHNLGHSPIT